MGEMGATELEELLVTPRARLLDLVSREARGLLRYDTAEDLVQAAHVRALQKAAAFEFQGEERFNA